MIYPDYYADFKCIADKCLHSCCIGWQICIDEDTFEKYMGCTDSYFEKLNKSIDKEEKCFFLGENERCPFLTENNLCDIIINKGEKWLCEICSEHPRFRSFVGKNELVGLGLSCEEVARIILRKKDKTVFVGDFHPEDETEKALFLLMGQVVSVLQNRGLGICERFEALEKRFGVGFPHLKPKDIALVMKGLERLDESWEKYIERLEQNRADALLKEEWQTAFEQLAVYFVYRYLPEGIYDGRYTERIALAGFSVLVIAMMFEEKGTEELEEIARRFSAEVEYCEENVEALLEVLGN